MTLFLSSDVNTTYTVEGNGGTISSGNITANAVTAVFIDPNIFDVYIGSSDVVEINKGIHITTGSPSSVYSIISHNARTAGSLILPTKTLGREYYAFSYQNKGNGGGTVRSEFTIVAVEDDTEIEITPTATSSNGARTANSTFKITQKLNKGDVYQYQASADVSGSLIKTLGNCKPVAVFSGSTWTAFCDADNPRAVPSGGDNLFQQLFPVSSWGKNFVTAPFYNTENGSIDIVRIIVSENNTNITVNGGTTIGSVTLTNPYAKGSIITYYTNAPSVIRADKPIGVAHYQPSQNCNPANGLLPGDPEMTILNPIEQTLSDITVFSKLNSVTGVNTNIQKYFLNIIIKTVDSDSLRVDGNLVSGFKPIDNQYSYVIIDVSNSQNQHRIVASGGFVAIAYGYGSFESYAYLAGADVRNLFQNLTASTRSGKSITSGCVNEATKFSLRLPYISSSIIWDIKNGQAAYTDNQPAFTTTVVDGKTIYIYNYPLADPVFASAGKNLITATSINPDPAGCDALEVTTMEFEIFDIPTAAFTAVSESCVNSEIAFRDTSQGNGKSIKKWMWDFGDGTTSSVQNPVHTYTKNGDFTVRLIVEGETGCASPVFSKPIHITILPIANFNYSSPDCHNQLITFTDASSSAEGKIIKWTWDPGDGTAPVDLATAANFIHTYTTTGTFKASLKLLSDKSCESIVMERSIVVHPTPVINFKVPEVCISDQFAVFTDSSSIAGGGTLSYLWNFGDSLSSGGNLNTSTLKNPLHKYSKAGLYQVRLTIRSSEGCETTSVQPFQVNGAIPKAAFTVLSPNDLCSNKEVVFINNSTVDFGTIGKIEWFFDYDNAPSLKVVDEDPQPGKQYRFQYPVFTSPASKPYKIRMLAYSGGSCADEEIQIINVISAPQVAFSAMPDVCLEVSPFRISQAAEITGKTGNGAYYGKGVSASGLFDPSRAGIGTHTIKFIFTAGNGCSDSLSRDITVMPTPTVYAGRDTFLLEGDQIKLSAVAAGSNLTYKWMPATGLSRDDIPDPLASPTDDVTYSLSVTSDQGCVAIDAIFVKVLKIPLVPNTFTPNGDGVNDLWNIKYLNDYQSPTVQLFNRYGAIIYSTTGYSSAWDGKINGTDAPVGTYYYIFQPKMGRKAISGSLTIIR